MATVSAPAKRAQRLRPAPLWLSLLLAFLAYFLLDFSLRLFYGSMSDVSLWAWQPLVFTLLWSGAMTAIAALLPRTGRRMPAFSHRCRKVRLRAAVAMVRAVSRNAAIRRSRARGSVRVPARC